LMPLEEVEYGMELWIDNAEWTGRASRLNLDHAPSWKLLLQELLIPILEEWIDNQYELEYSAFYGIRSYTHGLKLKAHKDRIATHHIAANIIIDRAGANWPLDIKDHEGNWHKVYAEPGQVILYESAICEHGRTEYFEGEYFRNCYLHCKLKDFNYCELER
jgi:hypothetical protein